MGPEDLAQVLRYLPPALPDANVIVGLDAPDDAGVYKLNHSLAIVQTVDFFTPVVDDAYAFGQIAAANALSDVYAMGARPITALNLVGFPIARLNKRILADILRGGAEKVAEAGAALLGGHSIDDEEPKYGLAVTGVVHPDQVMTKGGARPGDKLVLTKPIGIGTITQAIKKGIVPAAVQEEAVQVMAALNKAAAVLPAFGVRGLTDVTGFGLLGHAAEMARAAGVHFTIYASQVPVLAAAREYAAQGLFPGGSQANRRWLQGCVRFDPALSETEQLLLCDAVTSGGLLIAVPGDRVDALVAALGREGTITQAVIGEVSDGAAGCIEVRP